MIHTSARLTRAAFARFGAPLARSTRAAAAAPHAAGGALPAAASGPFAASCGLPARPSSTAASGSAPPPSASSGSRSAAGAAGASGAAFDPFPTGLPSLPPLGAPLPPALAAVLAHPRLGDFLASTQSLEKVSFIVALANRYAALRAGRGSAAGAAAPAEGTAAEGAAASGGGEGAAAPPSARALRLSDVRGALILAARAATRLLRAYAPPPPPRGGDARDRRGPPVRSGNAPVSPLYGMAMPLISVAADSWQHLRLGERAGGSAASAAAAAEGAAAAPAPASDTRDELAPTLDEMTRVLIPVIATALAASAPGAGGRGGGKGHGRGEDAAAGGGGGGGGGGGARKRMDAFRDYVGYDTLSFMSRLLAVDAEAAEKGGLARALSARLSASLDVVAGRLRFLRAQEGGGGAEGGAVGGAEGGAEGGATPNGALLPPEKRGEILASALVARDALLQTAARLAALPEGATR
jgi:hypothetical protein